jgi:hypothetical protein
MPAPPILLPLLWAQAVQVRMPSWLQWLFVWGDPRYTDERAFGAVITWTKVVGLFCLVAWSASWLLAPADPRLTPAPGGRGRQTKLMILLVGLLGCLLAVVLQVLQSTRRVATLSVAGVSVATLQGGLFLGLLLVLAEYVLWSNVRRKGRPADLAVLAGVHLALASGFVVSYTLATFGGVRPNWPQIAVGGAYMGVTYMGLVVLASIAARMLAEVSTLRPRRLYAVAWHTWVESFRRMWAPWVVLVVFAVILAFTSWFLKPPRDAELGRIYVGTLMLLTSILLTAMVSILAPVSLPQDIQQQTIYTVVSKPVRRLELVWGRVLGFMALVTVLLLVFGGISLAYLERNVGSTIAEARRKADEYAKAGKMQFARLKREEAEQLETRMSARVPVKGQLSFLDSRGKPKPFGIDVGQELEGRSFVEGATPSMAIWQFGFVPDKFAPKNAPRFLDRRVPLEALLPRGTIEELQNRRAELRDALAEAGQRQQGADLKSSESAALSADRTRIADEVKAIEAELKQLEDRDRELRRQAAAAKDRATAAGLIAQADSLHAPPVRLEMIFNVYRTTKGELGQPVYALLVVRNPRPNVPPHRAYLPIHEYYTDRQTVPARILVGSRGFLTIEVQCLTPNQYLGMAESDLYILSSQGRFWDNYLRGLFGIWLQALVLTTIGVFAGTFLSWPVALVKTLAFFVAGLAAVSTLQTIALQSLTGGGPFESLIRLLTHDNLQSDLAPTTAVIVAKTFDSLVMPVLARLVYVIPNFASLDFSNTVADGYAVTWAQAGSTLLLALGYALPFSVAGYFVLKHREVAA